MNKLNEALRLVRISNRKINMIRFSKTETEEHKNKKIEICNNLVKEGKSFITEAIFIQGGRADIFILDDLTIIEILKSEKLENIENKKRYYPKLKIISIQV